MPARSSSGGGKKKNQWLLLRASGVRQEEWGMEDSRVTLHGVSWAAYAVAPACIDLDREPG